jgi:hypothetical protein
MTAPATLRPLPRRPGRWPRAAPPFQVRSFPGAAASRSWPWRSCTCPMAVVVVPGLQHR